MSGCCWDAPLEVVTLSLNWSPLEVVTGYCIGADVCSGTTCLGWGNTLRDAGGKYSTVRQFAKIFCTDSIAASFESHILVGTYLRSADNKCMAWFILSSAFTWGCVRYACKFSDVYIIISDLVFLLISWMQQ